MTTDSLAAAHRHRRDSAASSRLVERWTRAIASNEKKLKRAKKAGESESVGKLEKILNRQRGWLARAQAGLTTDTMLAGAARHRARLDAQDRSMIDRRAVGLMAQAAERDKEWGRERGLPHNGKSAADRVERRNVNVDSPYGREHGVDQVVRVLHTIEHMHARQQIDDRQKMAADRYRWAFEACPSSIRCALDQSGRSGGGGLLSRSPTERQLEAAGWIGDATRLLGVKSNQVIRRICGEGQTVEDVARSKAHNGRRPPGRLHIKVSERFKAALTTLANYWWPEQHRMGGFRDADAKPESAQPRDDFDPKEFKGRVAHAADSGGRGTNAPGKVFGFESVAGQPDLRLKAIRGKRSRRGEARQ